MTSRRQGFGWQAGRRGGQENTGSRQRLAPSTTRAVRTPSSFSATLAEATAQGDSRISA